MVSKPYFATHEWPCTATTTTRPAVLHTFCWIGIANRLTVSGDIHGCRFVCPTSRPYWEERGSRSTTPIASRCPFLPALSYRKRGRSSTKSLPEYRFDSMPQVAVRGHPLFGSLRTPALRVRGREILRRCVVDCAEGTREHEGGHEQGPNSRSLLSLLIKVAAQLFVLQFSVISIAGNG
jgi:hypothetical protein